MPQNFNGTFRLNRKKFPQTRLAEELNTKAGIAIHNEYLISDRKKNF